MYKHYLKSLPRDWEATARVFDALGDSVRQRILLLFEPDEELSIKEIVDVFPFGRTTIVHHLRVLEQAHLLVRRRNGRDVFFRVDRSRLSNSLQLVLTYIQGEEEKC